MSSIPNLTKTDYSIIKISSDTHNPVLQLYLCRFSCVVSHNISQKYQHTGGKKTETKAGQLVIDNI